MKLPWHKTVTHKVKPVLSNKRDEQGFEKHLGKVAWHATRQAYRQLIQRRKREHP